MDEVVKLAGRMVPACVYMAGLAVMSGSISLCLAGIRFGRKRSVSCGKMGMAVVLFGVWLVIFILAGKVGKQIWRPIWVYSAVFALAFGGACIVFFMRLSLLPEESEILFPADKKQQRKIRVHVWVGTTIWLLYLAWLLFLVICIEHFDIREQILIFFFSLTGAAEIIYFENLSVKSAYERIETLIDKEYQAEMLNYMQIIRSQRHDFNFHMQAVAGMIENGRYEECSRYVQTMVENVGRLNDLLPLSNPAVSALINTFTELAASRGIRLEVQILDDLSRAVCTTYEMNTIIGNLLQNAVDETENKEADLQFIRLLVMHRSRYHIIKVSNPCEKSDKEFQKIFTPGYTTKQLHEGIGLTSVKKITARYGGTVYSEHEPGIIHFIAKLPYGSS